MLSFFILALVITNTITTTQPPPPSSSPPGPPPRRLLLSTQVSHADLYQNRTNGNRRTGGQWFFFEKSVKKHVFMVHVC